MILNQLKNLTLYHLGDYNYFKLELGAFGVPFTLLCVLFLPINLPPILQMPFQSNHDVLHDVL